MAVSSIFALLYNRIKAVLPDEAMESYDNWLRENAFPQMDAQGEMAADQDSRGEYYVESEGKTVVFHHQELAPPAGVAGVNYTQWVTLWLVWLSLTNFQFNPL